MHHMMMIDAPYDDDDAVVMIHACAMHAYGAYAVLRVHICIHAQVVADAL